MKKDSGFRNSNHYKDNIVKKIRGFCYAMKYKNITKAARFLCLTQPAISFQIRSLEKDLKLKLFKKEKNRIIPTDDAYKFYNFAQEALFNIENLYQNFLKLDSPSCSTELRIAGDEDYLSCVAVDFLNQIKLTDKIKVRTFQIEQEDELIDLFLKNIVDVIGISEAGLRKLVIEKKDFKIIREDSKHYGILVKREDFLHKKMKEIYLDINKMAFIYNEKYESKIKYFFEINNLKKNIFVDTKNSRLIENLIESDQGCSMCSSFNIKPISKVKNSKIRFIKISKLIKKDLFFSICKKNSFILSLQAK